MRILFYEDPLTEKHDLCWRFAHLVVDAVPYRNLRASGVECRVLINSHAQEWAIAHGIADRDLIMVDERELIAALIDPQDRVNHVFHEAWGYEDRSATNGCVRGRFRIDATGAHHYGHELARRLAEFYRSQLGQFVPDLIVSWFPVPFLKQLFPTARVVYKEAGFFGVAPFAWSHYLDPGGIHGYSWIRQNSCRAGSASALAAVQALRQQFIPNIEAKNPFQSQISEWKRRFRKLVLAALQANNFYLFDKSCGYRSQAHFLLDILDHVLDDVGVVVTLHPTQGTLSQPERALISRRHPNCLFHAEFESVMAPSQYVIGACDAVVTVGSAVGWHALFHGKPLVLLGDCHLAPAAASRNVKDLDRVVRDPSEFPVPEDHLAWVMFHFSVPQSLYAREGSAIDLLQRFLVRDSDPFERPVLPYEEYVDEVVRTAYWNIPVRK